MNWLLLMLAGATGFALMLLGIPTLIAAANRARLRRGYEFHHNHVSAVPRLGGLVLVVAFVGVEFFLELSFPEYRSGMEGRYVVVLGSLAMFGLGFWDDLAALGAKRKLIGQIVIATAVWVSGVGIQTFKIPFTGEIIELHAWGSLLTVAWLVGVTNLLNLIDGVDGLATGMGLMLLGLLAYMGMEKGTFTCLAAGMAGALVAFLWFNFPPARIYLGDGGAYFLGFQIGIYSLASSHKGTVLAALVAPLFVLALPIMDTSVAIMRRGLRGLPVFRADRGHMHHRLLRSGMTRRQVVLCFYTLSIIFLTTALAAFWSEGMFVPVLTGVGMLLILLSVGKLSFSREWLAVGRTLGNSLAMREQIQYALSLTSWLRLEANRTTSLDELFQDMVFAARRLGFSGVSLRLRNFERSWQQPGSRSHRRRFYHELRPNQEAVLELIASVRIQQDAAGSGFCREVVEPAVNEGCSGGFHPQMFELLADLLAEAWQPALAQCWAAAPVAMPEPRQRAPRFFRKRTRAQSVFSWKGLPMRKATFESARELLSGKSAEA